MGLEAIAEIEDALAECLAGQSRIDGHDVGLGEINIFIVTSDPQRAFDQVQPVLERCELWADGADITLKCAGTSFELLTILTCRTSAGRGERAACSSGLRFPQQFPSPMEYVRDEAG
jgi:hypothetical protein